jgi:hypothetical protein
MAGTLSEEMVSLYRERFSEWMRLIVRSIRLSDDFGPECLIWDPKRCRAREQVEAALKFATVQKTGVLFMGPKGTGKTTSAVHCVIEYLKWRCWQDLLKTGDLPAPETALVAWHAPHLFALLSCLYGEQGVTARGIVRQAQTAKVFLVDDVGREGGNRDAVAGFFEIVNTRYQKGRPMFITTHVAPDNWDNRETVGTDGQTVYVPGYRNGDFACCADRWRAKCEWIALTGPSMR